jgi:hypothetical protein
LVCEFLFVGAICADSQAINLLTKEKNYEKDICGDNCVSEFSVVDECFELGGCATICFGE